MVREPGPQPTDTFGGENDVTWRDDHGSGLDLTGSGLKPILAGSELERTAFFFKIGGSGLDRTEKICCFDVIILTTSKMLVVSLWYQRCFS